MRSPGLALSALLLTLSLTAGCQLYFGGGDDDCLYGGGSGGAAEPAIGQRNPDTGQCEFFGGGGPYPCDGTCGPCAETGAYDQAAQPSWGYCESQCTGLDEASCLTAPGCRGIYLDTCNGADCPDARQYAECWSTDQTGPIQGGSCDGLDAFSCSQHDDCIAVHISSCDYAGGAGLADPGCVPQSFEYCSSEPGGCYGDSDCGPGSHCNADEVCLPPPGCTGLECDAACYGTCVPGPRGDCNGEVLCDSLPPECPADTAPGIANGCWTGECIPLDQCQTPPPACATITAESSCVARADCTPFYRGEDCVCEGDACTCNWIFDSCE
jgi:hypothetical protein